MRISEDRQTAAEAREVCIRCLDCGKLAFARLPFAPTAEQRLRIIHGAVAEHRRIGCTKKTAEDGRKYELWYPRA